MPAQSFIALLGSVTVSGVSRTEYDWPVAYFTQDYLFFLQISDSETLYVAARLRLPTHLSRQARDAMVDTVVRKLGLLPAVDSRAGDAKTRGI